MKTLTFNEMENVNGGATERQCKVIYWTGIAAGVITCFGWVGLLIGGPTAIGMAIGSGICQYQ